MAISLHLVSPMVIAVVGPGPDPGTVLPAGMVTLAPKSSVATAAPLAACRASATSAAVFVSFGEALGLPVVHIAYPLPAGLSRWADPRVTGNMALTHGVHVRSILVGPCP